MTWVQVPEALPNTSYGMKDLAGTITNKQPKT